MEQTKLSKQQKKIIMVIGDSYYGKRKELFTNRIKLNREITNTTGNFNQFMGKSKNFKPMTNSAKATMSRSLKRLKKRGIIKKGYNTYELTDNQGVETYNRLMKKKNT